MKFQHPTRCIILVKYAISNNTRLSAYKRINQPKFDLLHIRIIKISI